MMELICAKAKKMFEKASIEDLSDLNLSEEVDAENRFLIALQRVVEKENNSEQG